MPAKAPAQRSTSFSNQAELPSSPRKLLKTARKALRHVLRDDRYLVKMYLSYHVETGMPGNPTSVNLAGATMAYCYDLPVLEHNVPIIPSLQEQKKLDALSQIELGNIDLFYTLLGRKKPKHLSPVLPPIYYGYDLPDGCKPLLKRLTKLIDQL